MNNSDNGMVVQFYCKHHTSMKVFFHTYPQSIVVFDEHMHFVFTGSSMLFATVTHGMIGDSEILLYQLTLTIEKPISHACFI